MRLLLDSHVCLWWLDDHPSLGRRCRATIVDADEVFFSAASVWELGIKAALGRLSMPDGLVAALEASGFDPLPVTAAHAEAAPALPPHHRDPFDRMLVAQARSEAVALVSADDALRPYEVELVDARQ